MKGEGQGEFGFEMLPQGFALCGITEAHYPGAALLLPLWVLWWGLHQVQIQPAGGPETLGQDRLLRIPKESCFAPQARCSEAQKADGPGRVAAALLWGHPCCQRRWLYASFFTLWEACQPSLVGEPTVPF